MNGGGGTGKGVRRAPVMFFADGSARAREDDIVVEEPLEIAVVYEEDGLPARKSVAVTMRTPGHDDELALGFLLTEGVVASATQVATIAKKVSAPPGSRDNVIHAELHPDVPFDPARFSRNVYTTSSCGICGKTSIDLVQAQVDRKPSGSTPIPAAVLTGLPRTLSDSQALFTRTGGLHAVALFDPSGQLLDLREDVGRHNAMDKLIGAMARAGQLPADDRLFLVSGRASFELVQKALVAGVATLAAVGAPSSLAIDLAEESGMTLVGFLRDGRFNVYSGAQRIRP